MRHDLLGEWMKLDSCEDEEGQPLPRHREAHERHYHAFVEAVAALAAEGKLHDVASFAYESLPPDKGHALWMDVISLATRHDQFPRHDLMASTRLFALPISGPNEQISSICQAEGFGDLMEQSGVFPTGSQVVFFGAAMLEDAAALRLDMLAQITRSLDTFIERNDETALHGIADNLAALFSKAGGEPGSIGHAVVVGACRQIGTIEELDEVDFLEDPTPESDLGWVQAFESWNNTNPLYAEQPWMTSPPAKWESGLADALVQASMLELAMGVEDDTGFEEMPRAARYTVLDQETSILITGSLDDGSAMGTLTMGPAVRWMLPLAIREWQSWGCAVDHSTRPSSSRAPTRKH